MTTEENLDQMLAPVRSHIIGLERDLMAEIQQRKWDREKFDYLLEEKQVELDEARETIEQTLRERDGDIHSLDVRLTFWRDIARAMEVDAEKWRTFLARLKGRM